MDKTAQPLWYSILIFCDLLFDKSRQTVSIDSFIDQITVAVFFQSCIQFFSASCHSRGTDLGGQRKHRSGTGVGKLNLSERPKDTPSKQAAAAVGQCELMHIYDDMFAKYNVTVAQILLTRATLTNERLPHVQNTIGRLLEMGVIPIVNENDTVAIDELELEIGENDSLSATVAAAVGADLLVILSDINGLYSADPRTNADAQVIREVHKIDEHIEQMAGGAGSALGSGGMATKIGAAELCMDANIPMLVANGDKQGLLYDIVDGKQVGTLFSRNNE